MEQIRIIKEMRENDKANGRTNEHIRPRYMVWENVPGAFSSNKGEDFRCVLEETARVADKDAVIPKSQGGKWTPSGCIMGDGWSIAWRVHDAQFWGVPQRRKRIALVADFGGESAPEILFERKGLQGDFEQSKQARKETAGTIGNSFEDASAFTLKIRGGCDIDANGKQAGKGALVQTELSGTLGVSQDQTLIQIGINGDIAGTLDVSYYKGCGERQGIERSCCGGKTVVLEGNGSRESHKGDGYKESEISYTLNAVEQHCVCCSGLMCLNDQGGSQMGVTIDKTGALRAQEHGHQPLVFSDIAATRSAQDGRGGVHSQMLDDPEKNFVLEPTVYDARGNGDGKISPTLTGDHQNRVTDYTALCIGNGQVAQLELSEKVGALNCMHEQQAVMTYGLDRASFNQGKNAQFDFSVEEEKIGAQVAKGPDAVCENTQRHYVVRRLTPLECERLQGYPDGWTDIGEWTDSKGKKHKEADTPKYKALGNSIALPFWQWMAERMVKQYDYQPTMASLFDGIGGFPLVYSRCGCKPVWASEIEEFPMAVTKIRFPED